MSLDPGRNRQRLLLIALAVVAVGATWSPASAGAFGIASFSVAATESDGSADRLAGSHPYALTTQIGIEGAGELEDLSLELPPGLIENPAAVAVCTQDEFQTPRASPYEASRSGESCPDASQIGVIEVRGATSSRWFGLFNLSPAPGHLSQFGASPFGAPVTFTPSVRQAEGEYGLTLASHRFSQAIGVRGLALTIWGSPWNAAHDGQRGDCLNESEPTAPYAECPVDPTGQSHGTRPYLTLPSDCAEALAFSASVDSWQQPGATVRAEAGSAQHLEGCAQLGFSGAASALPTAPLAASPTGLTFVLSGSQRGLLGVGERAESQVKLAKITLPEGMTINPSVGAGLGACTAAQYASESASTPPGAGCPNPSKIGVVTLETPLVEGVLNGSLFIATPFENPFGAAYALYFVARSAQRGLIVKVAGELEADQRTGRLTATFDDLPRLPYFNLKVQFREGQRAPLVTPPSCGTYSAQAELHPWAEPGASLRQFSSFQITRGIGGGPCPTGAAPFAPKATAGTINAAAGSATSFYLHLTRSDSEQEITSYSTALPPGLLGSIAGIPYCPDAAIEAARSKGGTAESEHPSCPAASQIGTTYSGYGVGLAPAYSPGRFYLAGPYHGAPLSVVAINPVLVGPFDLGTIVIRSAIDIDPRSAQVTIDSVASDPIPHIFAGLPLRLRDVRVHIDRPGFMVNPTSCAPFSIASTLTGSDTPFTNPRGATSTSTVPFQAFSCSSLGFAPKLSLAVKGKPRRGGYQRLQVTVTPRRGDANIASAAVTLPPAIFLAQNHIRTICTRGQSASDNCPAASIIGTATAQTPLLSDPLTGPVYLRSSDNPLPDLVTALHGPAGIRIVLECRIDSFHAGLRGRCENLPDAPVAKFTMTIFGGRKRGILVASENLCRKPQLATARLVGQDDAGEARKPRLAVKCKRHR